MGIAGINHPKDLFDQDIKQLRMVAENLIGGHKRWGAGVGFAAGAPGGIVGFVGGTAIDLEEYLRRLFRLAQEVGQVYGLIPNPFTESIDDSMHNYFENKKIKLHLDYKSGFSFSNLAFRIQKLRFVYKCQLSNYKVASRFLIKEKGVLRRSYSYK